MNQGAASPAVDPTAWEELLRQGRTGGSLTQEQVCEVLDLDVERFDADLSWVMGELERLGIRLDERADLLDAADLELAAADAAAETAAIEEAAHVDGLLADPLGGIDVATDEAFGRGAPGRRLQLVRGPVRSGDRSGGTSDPVRVYLKEIGRIPLVTRLEERALAQRIEAGGLASVRLAELEAAGRIDELHLLDRRKLERTVRDGDRAKSDMIQANLRLVVSIAKRYSGRGLHLLDIVQEGNLGLMRAVEKFDHSKGFKFSTYATWWIRQAITRALADQSRTIRIPVHMVDSINRVHRLQRQLLQELEREPTVDELAAKTDMTPERVREILRISQDPLSLDSPVGESDDSNLSDFIEDTQADAPAEMATRNMLGKAVVEALSDLSDREKEVVRLRFGLDDGQARTLEEVGREFNVTRERIRQIEAKTLAKLRNPNRSQKLRSYLDDD